MTTLDAARAGAWGHDSAKAKRDRDKLLCGECDQIFRPHTGCPVRIARFADIKAHEKAIDVVEALAKERCDWCRLGRPLTPVKGEYVHCGKHASIWDYECLAQPEQRRLAQLREELAELKATEGKPEA
jgi:hypothetical protein